MSTHLTDIDPASIETSHGDIETLSFQAEQIGHWNGTILKYHGSGWLRIPPHLQNVTQMTFIR
jgi:hypothetical protein